MVVAHEQGAFPRRLAAGGIDQRDAGAEAEPAPELLEGYRIRLESENAGIAMRDAVQPMAAIGPDIDQRTLATAKVAQSLPGALQVSEIFTQKTAHKSPGSA